MIYSYKRINSGNWSEQTKTDYADTNHRDVISKGINSIVGKTKVDLVIGGPPCQAYSIAGRAQDGNSMQDDYRNYLFESFVKVVDEYHPQVFVFENVPGMLSARPGGKLVTERIYEAFTKIGYVIRKPEELKHSVCTASDFEVPQKRNRVILVGVNKHSNIDLEKVYEAINNSKNFDFDNSVKTAIGGKKLPKFIPLKHPSRENGKNISHVQVHKKHVSLHVPIS